LKSVVTRLSVLVLLALGAGVGAGVFIGSSEYRAEAALAFAAFAIATAVFSMRLTRTLLKSLEQFSQTLGRLAKGEFDAPVPEFGSIDELRRMSRQFAEFVAEVTRVLTSVRSAANALVAASSQVSSASQAL
jgi:methyl-accepting chemotaxis protein